MMNDRDLKQWKAKGALERAARAAHRARLSLIWLMSRPMLLNLLRQTADRRGLPVAHREQQFPGHFVPRSEIHLVIEALNTLRAFDPPGT